jgi:polysaccharide biosynthesis protein PslH
MVTSSLPYPPTTGGKVRVWNLLKRVAQRHEVVLLSLLDSAAEMQFVPYLQQYCTHVETVVKRRRRSRGKLLLRLLETMLKGQPPRNGIAYYEEMKPKVQELVSSQFFDVVHVEQSHMAPYIEFMDAANNAAYLITLYDVGAKQYERILRIQSRLQSRFLTRLDGFFLRRWEPAYVARHFRKCVVVSAVDRDLLRRANPTLDPVVVPNGVDTAQYELLPECPGSKEILLVGKMNYTPNVDGALFFYREVFPLVQEQVPLAHLLIVGTSPVPEIQALAADPAVEVTGQVEDIVPYYRRACLSTVSLRAGGGTRLKILESMALGRPVVSTTIGCEGLDVVEGEHLLIADSPEQFAEKTVRLLTDQRLRQYISTRARKLVETYYDWNEVAERLMRVYGEMSGQPDP